MVSFFTPGAGDPTAVGDYAAELNTLLSRKQPPQTLTQPILAALPAIDTTMPTPQGGGGLSEDEQDAETIKAISGAVGGILGAYGSTQGAGAPPPTTGTVGGGGGGPGAPPIGTAKQYVEPTQPGPGTMNSTSGVTFPWAGRMGGAQSQQPQYPTQQTPQPPPQQAPRPRLSTFKVTGTDERGNYELSPQSSNTVSTATAPDGSSVLKNPLKLMSLLDPSFSWYAASGMGG